MTDGSKDWEVVTDCVMVGSGGGSMCAALAVKAAGLQALAMVLTRTDGGGRD